MADLVGQLLGEIRKQRKRIVVIGDVLVDRWIQGHTTGCQEGCPKFVQYGGALDVPGGAANAERSISRWDVNTSIYGWSHDDCPVKYRYTEGNKIVFRADDEGLPRQKDGYHWAREMSTEMVYRAGGVLLSDYDKGFLTPELIRKVAAICRDTGIPCVADCKREPGTYDGCTLKCNSDYQNNHNQELARRVFDAEPGQRLVVTAGNMNPVIWDEAGPLGLGYDLLPVRCVNHVGAGDCFAAHLTLALAYGFVLKDAAALAHSAGRVYVQYEHSRPPLPTEVAADLAGAK